MSPRTKARITGMLYLLTIVAGVIAEGFISGGLVTSSATTTATNILSHESLYRLGFSVYLVEMMCQIATTMLFYQLLKPVSKSVAALALVFALVGCTIKTIARLFYYAPLLVLGGAPYLGAFSPSQLQSLSLLLLKVNSQGAGIALAFFGTESLLEGWLILKSTFLPRWLGVLGIIGGAGWLMFIWPPLGSRVFNVVALFAIVGSLALILWLLIKGVNEERWLERAMGASTSIWQ